MSVININASHGIFALWFFRLLLDTNNLSIFNFRNAKALRVSDFRKRQETIAIALLKFIDESFHAADDHIITEIKNEIILADKLF